MDETITLDATSIKQQAMNVTIEAVKLREMLTRVEQECRMDFFCRPVSEMSIGELVRVSNALCKFKQTY